VMADLYKRISETFDFRLQAEAAKT